MSTVGWSDPGGTLSRKRWGSALVAVFTAVLIGVFTGPSASAQGYLQRRPVDLVVVGDSFSSGEGNAPFLDASACHRSAAAFGPLLARAGLIRLQAFPACSGATTVQVWKTGQNGEPPQIDHITARTDVVTVQALGNDVKVGQLEGLCIFGDCSAASASMVQAIGRSGPGLLDALYDHIVRRPGFTGKVIALLYANPFPDPTSPVGPGCPYMSAAELRAASAVVAALNTQIIRQAHRHGFAVADPAALFRGHDLCGNQPAFYNANPTAPPDPGWLHPNQFGQTLYALAVAPHLPH